MSCERLAEEENAGCYALNVLLMSCFYLCLFLALPWAGLPSVLVTFTGYTQLTRDM